MTPCELGDFCYVTISLFNKFCSSKGNLLSVDYLTVIIHPYRHPEFISGSQNQEMLKRVQHDTGE